MAEVYKARASGSEGFTKTVCVKRILPQFARDETFTRMLIAEANVTGQLQHANVVQVYDLQQSGGELYLVMEHVDGCDLLRVLTTAARNQTRLDVALVLNIIVEVAKGLDYAHHATDASGRPLRIVHRDVSPSNILLSRQGEIKVVDFGVAHADGSSSQDEQRRAGALQGKLGYLSPELVTNQPADHRSDIFALGICLFEALTLRRLFLGRSQVETLLNVRDVRLESKLRRHAYIPEEIQAILRRALARDPAARYSQASELQEALKDVLFAMRSRVTSRDIGALVEQTLAEENPPVRAAPVARKTRRHQTQRPRLSTDTDIFQSPFQRTPAQAVTEGSPWNVFKAPPTPIRSVQDASIVLRGSDAKPFGPVTYDNLLRLIGSGSVGDQEEASVDGGPWVPLTDLDLPELEALKKQPARRFPDIEGPFNPLRGPELLNELSQARATGRLEVTRGKARKEVYLRDGLVVSVTSTVKSELLASFMQEHHLISTSQVSEALGEMARRGGRLGRTLVAQGIIKWEDLSRILREQFRFRFLQLFTWLDAWYAFTDGEAPVDAELPIVEEIPPLLARAVRLHYGLSALEEAFEPHLQQVIRWVPERPYDLSRFRFRSPEEAAAGTLGEGAILTEVLQGFPASPDRKRVLQAALLLHQTGFIRFEEVTAS